MSFVALDVYPDIARGWWCLVEQFSSSDGTRGGAGGEHDNTTSSTPFKRLTSAENSELDWLDWLSFGGAAEWDDEPRRRQSYFGIAPVQTARLTVTAEDGCERELRVTPWNGAFVVASPGTHSALTGYDVEDNVLGTLSIGDSARTAAIAWEERSPARRGAPLLLPRCDSELRVARHLSALPLIA